MESRSLLVSDLDGTLLGDDEALDRFAEWYEAHRTDLRLAYATGRSCASVAAMIASTSLPEPDAVVGSVGAEIHLYPGGKPLDDWPGCSVSWDAEGIRAALDDLDELEPQPDEFQTEFKVCYYGDHLDADFLIRLQRRLAAAGHRVEVGYSADRYLDVLPPGVNKGSAVAHLASRWRLPPRQVLVAGDTGNDLSMFARGYCGIVVGNAHKELRSLRHVNVYRSEHTHADGVLDGVRYWLNRPRGFHADSVLRAYPNAPCPAPLPGRGAGDE